MALGSLPKDVREPSCLGGGVANVARPSLLSQVPGWWSRLGAEGLQAPPLWEASELGAAGPWSWRVFVGVAPGLLWTRKCLWCPGDHTAGPTTLFTRTPSCSSGMHAAALSEPHL